jgi:hypothetical protein
MRATKCRPYADHGGRQALWLPLSRASLKTPSQNCTPVNAGAWGNAPYKQNYSALAMKRISPRFSWPGASTSTPVPLIPRPCRLKPSLALVTGSSA